MVERIKVSIESVDLVGGNLEVVCRRSNGLDRGDNARPDSILKEIYIAKDGEIVLDKTINAKVTPEKVIPGSYEFNDH